MNILKYLIFFIILLLVYELGMHYQHVVHHIVGSKRDIPTPFFIINKIKKICNTIIEKEKKPFIFIDIGCGDGETLKVLCKSNVFRKCIGIEIDKKIYEIAKSNIKNTNIELYNLDALDYQFRIQPTIVYLYEPFHDVDYNKAIPLYHQLLKKIKGICESTLYIVYVSGTNFKRQDLHKNSEMFSQYGFQIINKYNIGSLIYRRMIYVVKCIK